jgi:alkanesulfonate monooxygenase SsuD/methylene tetrahydromethanopterin reductase-like flavin-dependent oxidoreductase (luciferase family)
VRASQLADGWIGAGSVTFEEYFGDVERLNELLGARRRTFTIAKRVYIHVGTREAALSAAEAWLDAFYGRPGLAGAVAVTGSVDKCLERLLAILAAGTDHLLLHPIPESPDQLEVLGDRLLPSLRRM